MRAALLILIFSMGCAGAASRGPQTADAIVRAQAEPRALVDGRNGEEVSLDTLFSALRTQRETLRLRYPLLARLPRAALFLDLSREEQAPWVGKQRAGILA